MKRIILALASFALAAGIPASASALGEVQHHSASAAFDCSAASSVASSINSASIAAVAHGSQGASQGQSYVDDDGDGICDNRDSGTCPNGTCPNGTCPNANDMCPNGSCTNANGVRGHHGGAQASRQDSQVADWNSNGASHGHHGSRR